MKRYKDHFQEDKEQFDPWSVYSDLYCGLLLVFVLLFFFAIYRYLSLAEINQRDTDELHAKMQTEQQAVLAIYKADIEDQETAIEEKNAELERQSAALAITVADIEDREALLEERETELALQSEIILQQQLLLDDQTSELDEKQAQLDAQSTELANQRAQLDAQSVELANKQNQLDVQSAELIDKQNQLDEKNRELDSKQILLDAQTMQLADKQTQLDEQTLQLEQQKTTIDQQQALLQEQAQQIEDIVGVRSDLIRSLNQHLQANGIQVQADAETGAIIFESSLLFELGSDNLRPEGEAFIREFFPLYMEVLLRPEYQDYVAEIIVEGHTDNEGSYLFNLELSQQRALSVVSYCLSESSDFMSPEAVEMLSGLMAANGKSFSDPVYNEDGTINAEESRRVEIQFRLRDQEMVNALDEILTESGAFGNE